MRVLIEGFEREEIDNIDDAHAESGAQSRNTR